MEKCDLSDTGTRRPHEDAIDYMALVPTQKILEIALDYLYNDKQVQEIVVYMQSEEFPKIQNIFKYLKEYKYVSAFVFMYFRLQFNRKIICSISTCDWIALL